MYKRTKCTSSSRAEGRCRINEGVATKPDVFLRAVVLGTTLAFLMQQPNVVRCCVMWWWWWERAGVSVAAFETALGRGVCSGGGIGRGERRRMVSLAAKRKGGEREDGVFDDVDDVDDLYAEKSDSREEQWQAPLGTMDTALCIIPPDEVWDHIQQARHLARDPSFYRWPPAIRLFHPFTPHSHLPDAAFSLADLIDRYRLEPFNITFDRLSIIPHLEELEGLEDAWGELPEQEEGGGSGGEGEGEEGGENEMAIVEEEKKGRAKLKKRLANLRAKEERRRVEARERGEEEEEEEAANSSSPNAAVNHTNHTNHTNNTNTTNTANPPKKRRGRRKQLPEEKISPTERVQRQREQQNTFNGPCIICLEPDDKSKLRLLAFREILRKKVFQDYDPFSPSSTLSKSSTTAAGNKKGTNAKKTHTVSTSSKSNRRTHHHYHPHSHITSGLPRSVLETHGLLPHQLNQNNPQSKKRSQRPSSKRRRKKSDGSTFRPLLTLGKFSTVTSAVKIARQVQKVWKPLTFRVTDLHIVSRMESDSLLEETASGIDVAAEGGLDGLLHTNANNREYELRKLHGTTEETTHEGLLMSKGEYGCDAVVVLSGEEGQLDSAVEEGVLQIQTVGTDGDRVLDLIRAGGSVEDDAGVSMEEEEEEEEDLISDDMEELLGDGEDWDEGATIVVGRTQFYMGEMRQYIGMPASSTMDGKDRILGEDVSATMRRRGSTHRKANRWDDGDFGVKLKDKRAK